VEIIMVNHILPIDPDLICQGSGNSDLLRSVVIQQLPGPSQLANLIPSSLPKAFGKSWQLIRPYRYSSLVVTKRYVDRSSISTNSEPCICDFIDQFPGERECVNLPQFVRMVPIPPSGVITFLIQQSLQSPPFSSSAFRLGIPPSFEL
jgi:hypothetical protein